LGTAQKTQELGPEENMGKVQERPLGCKEIQQFISSVTESKDGTLWGAISKRHGGEVYIIRNRAR